ncbi:MAG: tRNA lysidine(34) synthetase TilS [Pirellulales bacterium]
MERTDRLPHLIDGRFPAASWSDHRILVGVSGGSDSVALLRALHALAQTGSPLPSSDRPVAHQARPRIHVAHYNHHWRGSESDADQQFVATLCQQLNVVLHVGHAPSGIVTSGTGASGQSEASARRQRHRFLRETAEHAAARFVLTAHTRDDQIETVLFRLLRGTGLRGLSGIRPRRLISPAVTLVRPMLDATRHEVLEYLAAIGQPYREDSSNTDRRYLRNRIRHQLLPLLVADYFPAAPQALARLAEQAGDLSDWLDEVVAQELDRSVRFQATETPAAELSIQFHAHQRPLIRVEIVRAAWRQASWPEMAMTERHWRALIEPPAVERWPAVRSFPAHVTARWIDPDQLVLTRPTPLASPATPSVSLQGANHHETA